MARGTIPQKTLVMNGGTIEGSPTTPDPTNGHVIQVRANGNIFIRAKNTGGTIGTIYVVPGANPPAFRNGIGTLEITVPITTGERIICIESARFAQANGDIYLDLSASYVAGSLEVYRLPNEF